MRNPSKIKKWKFEELLPKMSILFVDESTFEISQKMWRILARKGEKPDITWYETRHKWISVTGTYWIDWDFTYQTSNTKKTKDFLMFLYKIRHKIKKKWILLIIDNASIHRSKKVKKYCGEHNIMLIFLPPYSPEYNKIEFVWKWLKRAFRKIQRKYDNIRKWIKMASNAIKDEFNWTDIYKLINFLDS